MRSVVALLALAAAATATTTQLTAREYAQACAMKTMLASSACNTGDAACLCSDTARKSVMQEIKAACGAEQSESTERLATEACSKQKVRRAMMPSVTVVHTTATPSSPASGRVNGVQQASGEQGCTCANTPAVSSEDPKGVQDQDEDPAEAIIKEFDQDDDLEDTQDGQQHGQSHSANTPSAVDASAQSSRVHAASMAATPASSSSARHGAMATPSHSPSASGENVVPFKGTGAQFLPSITVVGAGILAGVVGVFAAL